MTNEEKIRSMDREALAEFLVKVESEQPEYCKHSGNEFCGGEACIGCAMKWLTDEADK